MDDEQIKLLLAEAKKGMEDGCPQCSYVYTLIEALTDVKGNENVNDD